MHTFGVREAQERLAAAGGGYEVACSAPGLEVGVTPPAADATPLRDPTS
jgi:signal transduction histidine kinase